MSYIFHVNVARCIGCGKCELACAFAHGSNGAPGETRIHVVRRGPEAGLPLVCLQCDDAACVAVCPADALSRNPHTGAIELAGDRCLRCRACVAACPFGNITWDARQRIPVKCDLCGGEPRCVAFCPTATLEYMKAGSRKRLLAVSSEF